MICFLVSVAFILCIGTSLAAGEVEVAVAGPLTRPATATLHATPIGSNSNRVPGTNRKPAVQQTMISQQNSIVMLTKMRRGLNQLI